VPQILEAKTKHILVTALLGIAWTATVAFGSRALLNYESSPGRVGMVPPAWPADSGVRLLANRSTLVMFAHPHCPCTRASVEELARMMARVQGKVSAYVLFYKPRDSGHDWEKTDLRRTAAEVPGVTVLSDVDGAEARRFGAETSGHTLLFDFRGRLLFSGGITQSRGHSGDNDGESAILSIVNNQATARTKTFIFGCALTDREKKGKGAQCLR
jgi:hypothetical protein